MVHPFTLCKDGGCQGFQCGPNTGCGLHVSKFSYIFSITERQLPKGEATRG